MSAEPITNEELADLFGDFMPIDVVIVLHELRSDLEYEERMGVLRRFLDRRATAMHEANTEIEELRMQKNLLEDRISDLKLQNQGNHGPYGGY